MRIHTLALLLGASLTLGACGDKDDDGASDSGADGSDASDSSDGSDGSDGASDGTDGAADGTASLAGTVVFGDGAPAEGLQMRLCYTGCRVANTDASGNFLFEQVEEATHTLQVVALGDLEMSSPHAMIALGDGEARTLGAPITLVPYENWTAMSGTDDYKAGGFLTLKGASPDDLSYGAYSPSPEAPFIAGARLPAEAAGLPADGLPEDKPVLAIWYLGQFDATVAGAGWAYEIEDNFGQAPGAKVQAYVSSNEDKGWIDAGTATVGEDGILRSDDGAGITKLNTLVLVPAE